MIRLAPCRQTHPTQRLWPSWFKPDLHQLKQSFLLTDDTARGGNLAKTDFYAPGC
jgi:hypothetical protein